MHRTDGADNIENKFTDEIPGTVVTASWLNAVQEEIAGVIEGAGMSLNSSSADSTDQLLAAINSLIDKAVAARTLADHPIGSVYAQFPAAASNIESEAFPVADRPATKYGGTWSELYEDEAITFRTFGESDTRTNGYQADAMQGHRHKYWPIIASNATAGGGYSALSTEGSQSDIFPNATGPAVTDGVSGTTRTASETRMKNRRMKVWVRTA